MANPGTLTFFKLKFITILSRPMMYGINTRNHHFSKWRGQQHVRNFYLISFCQKASWDTFYGQIEKFLLKLQTIGVSEVR